MSRYDLPKGMLGRDSFYEKGNTLHQEMLDHGLEHIYIVPNDGHEWANWRERTSEILTYHVVAGKVKSSDLSDFYFESLD